MDAKGASRGVLLVGDALDCGFGGRVAGELGCDMDCFKVVTDVCLGCELEVWEVDKGMARCSDHSGTRVGDDPVASQDREDFRADFVWGLEVFAEFGALSPVLAAAAAKGGSVDACKGVDVRVSAM